MNYRIPDRVQKSSKSKCKILVVNISPTRYRRSDVYTQKLDHILQRINFYKHRDVYSPHGVARVANSKNIEACMNFRGTLR
jgi:hypothetical protein